jgi:hypothetical protein
MQARFLAHEGHGVRLRDRLLTLDRQRAVVVRPLPQMRRHKLLTRHAPHRLQHPTIRNAATNELLGDHLVPGKIEIHGQTD